MNVTLVITTSICAAVVISAIGFLAGFFSVIYVQWSFIQDLEMKNASVLAFAKDLLNGFSSDEDDGNDDSKEMAKEGT